MSKRAEMAVLNKTVSVPGVRFGRTGLVFEGVVDAGLLEVLGATLQEIDVCRAWWWGDFLAKYCGLRLREDEEVNGRAFDAITEGEKLAHYSAHYAAICDKDPKTLWHWRSVADFYTLSRRRESLTWSHHIEAKEASGGDQAIADNWLDQAEEHGWSVERLRKAIRASRATPEAQEPEPQLVLPMELVAARRYVSAAMGRVERMDIAEAEAQLAYLQPVLAYATALHNRLTARAGGGKESLPVAA